MSLYGEMQKVIDAIPTGPRPAAWVGTKVALWDLLADIGAKSHPHDVPEHLPYGGIDIRYDETHPPGMVTVLDQHGDAMVRLIKDRAGVRWYAAHLGSWMNLDEPIDPTR